MTDRTHVSEQRVTERASLAGPGEYPTPETEQGRLFSRRLAAHGLDFNRSIWNVEREAALAAVRRADEGDSRCAEGHPRPVAGCPRCEDHIWSSDRADPAPAALDDCVTNHCQLERGHAGRHRDAYGSYFGARNTTGLADDLEAAMRGGYVAELPTGLIAERLLAMGWTPSDHAPAAPDEPEGGQPAQHCSTCRELTTDYDVTDDDRVECRACVETR